MSLDVRYYQHELQEGKVYVDEYEREITIIKLGDKLLAIETNLEDVCEISDKELIMPTLVGELTRDGKDKILGILNIISKSVEILTGKKV